MKQIIGRKIGMTQVFATDGTSYAVTVVEVLPNVVTQVKTVEHDGYDAIQVGVQDKKENRANNCEKGHFKKANVSPKQFLFELKGDEMKNYQVGNEIKCDLFQAGEMIDVVGTSKGHGYSGTIKRWNMKIGPKGHGSGYHRGQGSFANNGRCNNRVIPGKHMSGHYGNESCTIQNLIIVESNIEKGYILVKGGLPGPKKSFLTIKSAYRKQFGNQEVIKELVKKNVAVEAQPVVEPTEAK